MKNIMTIIKKELRRFFTDKRMVISLLLPGILIFVLYSIMGNFTANGQEVEDDYQYQAVVVNFDERLENHFAFLSSNKYEITYLTTEDDETYFQALRDKTLDLYVVYPTNFYDDALNFDPEIQGNNTSPIVKIYHNSSKKESYTLYNIYTSGLISFQESISEKFRVNADSNIEYDLASKESMTIQIITMLVPFLLVTFLFTGAMSISIESIAGEKERGTIATLLATPVKRNEIALGKIISLSIVSLTSAASSFIGLMLSLPQLMSGVSLDLSIYGVGEYLLLFFVLITTTLVYVVLISIVSAYAKSIKEASSLSSVLMIVNMLVGITSMSGLSANKTAYYFIPIYNSVQSISAILSLEINTMNLMVTSFVNLGIVGIGIYLLTVMFNSEKVMFNK